MRAIRATLITFASIVVAVGSSATIASTVSRCALCAINKSVGLGCNVLIVKQARMV